LIFFRRAYLNIAAVVIGLALIIYSGWALHIEWRNGYVALDQLSPANVNLATYHVEQAWEQVYRPIVSSRKKGLEQVKLYTGERNISALLKNRPQNIKNWQRSFMVYPGGGLERIKMRLRGDNPINWGYGKKSWRIKTRKKRMIRGARIYNYWSRHSASKLDIYLANWIAQSAGLLVPKTRIVELVLNDKSQGIYTEIEHLDESFLRKNMIMPVNLYKGEQDNIERFLHVNNYLFENPALWSKTATFNQQSDDNIDDLAFVLDLIRQAKTSMVANEKLKRVARFSEWARFSAFQILIQNWHNTAAHNMRLVSDPWRGTITPIPHDNSVNAAPNIPVHLGNGGHSLLKLYKRSSEFLVEEFRFLQGFLKKGLLSKAGRHIESLIPALKTTYSREPFRAQEIHIMGTDRAVTTEEGMKTEWKRLVDGLRFVEETLKKRLAARPKVSWRTEYGDIVIVIDGEVPVDDITLRLAPGSPWPNKIAWDSDGDQRLSDNDFAVPFERVKGGIKLTPTWLANRVFINTKGGLTDAGVNRVVANKIKVVPTQFRLVANRPLTVEAVTAANALTSEVVIIPDGATAGVTPVRTNIPIVPRHNGVVENWSNVVVVDGIRIVDRPVQIQPGTTLRMGPGASLVFRASVKVLGTPANPVRIVAKVPGKSWGALVLHGRDVSGSVIANTIVEGGSGAVIDGVLYTGMVSVHEADSVEFNNVSFSGNSRFDDMVHVVYSRNITFRNCLFEDAFADALDVDISEVRILGCRIIGSRNDAVDAMSSRVLIQDTSLRVSGDKGVSVGEKSNVLIVNSQIVENQTGVAVKDGSTAYIVNSDLQANRTQVSAFRKNWRYGAGGKLLVEKSFLLTQKSKLSADKASEIRIVDSTVIPRLKARAGRIQMDALSQTYKGRSAQRPKFSKRVGAILDMWRVTANSEIRGVSP
jgi:hypothetical protein